ncbi:MAG: hypothetical protein ACRD4Q_01705 [Candidatus Acidiferrales bacterium]
MGATPIIGMPVPAAAETSGAGGGPPQAKPADGVRFRFQGAEPPSTLYIERDSVLFISQYTLGNAYPVTVSGRILEPDGRIVPFEFTPNLQGMPAGSLLPINLTEGYLLSVLVTTQSPAPFSGQAYVQLFVGKGTAALAMQLSLIAAGYVTYTGPLGWPGGAPRAAADGAGLVYPITSDIPAPSQTGLIAAFPNVTTLIHAMWMQLTTSAVAASRTVTVYFSGGGVGAAAWQKTLPAAFTASQTYTLSGGLGVGVDQALQPDNSLSFSLPYVKLNNGFGLGFTINNAQAGDKIPSVSVIPERWATDAGG